MQTTLKKQKPVHQEKAKTKLEQDPRAALAQLQKQLDLLHNGFDTTTDPVLIDSLIYEIMSVNMKYKFYLNKCRSGNVTANTR